jgi:hypothetical protein
MGTQPHDVFSFQKNTAAGGTVYAGNQIKHCGFAGTVGSDESSDLTRFDVQVVPVHRPQAPEIVRHVVHLQKRHFSPRFGWGFWV